MQTKLRPLMSGLSRPRHLCISKPVQYHGVRSLTSISPLQAPSKKSGPIDESSWASAQHKPSLGNSSFGHLISELSSTKEGMEHMRKEGETMSEEHRAQARGVVKWLIVGGAVVVGVTVGLGLKRILWPAGTENEAA